MAGRIGQQRGPWWRRWGLQLGSGLLVVSAVGLGLLWWQAPALYDNVDPEAQASAAATTRAGILAVVAATVAAAGATVALVESRRANREVDERERYAKAIDHLGAGDDKVDVRLGGIYTLQRIAQDSDRDLPTVVDVLCAFVRVHGQGPEDDSDEALESHRPPPDVQAALTVIRRVHRAYKSHIDLRIDLQGAHLERVDLSTAYLAGADLTNADLSGADLVGAEMNGATLSGANLTNAELP
jgi:Pentapeptide repeats (8 copies)